MDDASDMYEWLGQHLSHLETNMRSDCEVSEIQLPVYPVCDILWMKEFRHQLIGGKHPIMYRVSILLVVQDFFHPPYVYMCNVAM